jgi:hypothetical protein
MNQFLKEMQDDCQILLQRALNGKTLACFGIDGFGQYGQCDTAQMYSVHDVAVELYEVYDTDYPEAIVIIMLNGYDAYQYGNLSTDRNFQISLNALLRAQEIDTQCWDWCDQSLQLEHSIVLKIDPKRLMQW